MGARPATIGVVSVSPECKDVTAALIEELLFTTPVVRCRGEDGSKVKSEGRARASHGKVHGGELFGRSETVPLDQSDVAKRSRQLGEYYLHPSGEEAPAA